MKSFTREGLEFEVRDAGPEEGGPVILLHGFPQDSRCWDALCPLLHARGYRTIAPDQRGYSPNARPRGPRAYRLSKLVEDVVELIEVVGLGPVHLVGHDWGAVVAWRLAAERPELLRSLAAVSVPHPAALTRALFTSGQAVRSWYVLFFQLPWLPERALAAEAWERSLRSTGMSPLAAARASELMRDHGVARAALNWYRAIVFSGPPVPERLALPAGWRVGQPARRLAMITVPTLYVWSDRDPAIGRQAAALTARFVSGPYTYEVLDGISHWIPEEAPERLDALLARHFESVAADGD
jgi:pimeloyl-ACP methyl ester carboxylesterase